VKLVIAVVAVLGLTVWVASSDARTWHIRADGTGDAPTIQAGVDSAVAGDIVLVAPGTHYVVDRIDIPSGIVVTSESGPAVTIVQPSVVPTYGLFGLVGAGSEISGLWMKPVQVAAVSAAGADARISSNIIEGMSITDSGIMVYERASITNNLIFGAKTGILFLSCPSGTVVENNIILNGVDCLNCSYTFGGYCNILRGTSTGYCVVGYDVDPQFCGLAGSGNYYLQADSPCAPGHIGYCGLIGPLPVGCGSVATEEKTWGAIKAIYQE
jgi:hypothetical protein